MHCIKCSTLTSLIGVCLKDCSGALWSKLGTLRANRVVLLDYQSRLGPIILIFDAQFAAKKIYSTKSIYRSLLWGNAQQIKLLASRQAWSGKAGAGNIKHTFAPLCMYYCVVIRFALSGQILTESLKGTAKYALECSDKLWSRKC